MFSAPPFQKQRVGEKKYPCERPPGTVMSRFQSGQNLALPLSGGCGRDRVGYACTYLDLNAHAPRPERTPVHTSRPSVNVTGVLGADRSKNCARRQRDGADTVTKARV